MFPLGYRHGKVYAFAGDCTSITIFMRECIPGSSVPISPSFPDSFSFSFLFIFFISFLPSISAKKIYDLFPGVFDWVVYSLGHESRVLAYIYLHLSFERKRAFYSLAWGQFGIRICIGMLRRYLFGAGLFIPYPRAFICFMMLGSCLGV